MNRHVKTLERPRPTEEQLRCLTPIERLNFSLMDWANRTPWVKRSLGFIASTVGMAWVEMAASRLVMDYGFEHFEAIDPNRGVLLVANHRSFYDLYAVAARLFRKYGNHHDIYFPVRSTFFYTNLLGLAIDIPVALASMYPPIVRNKAMKAWNRFAVDLMVYLLEQPRTMIGYHPEGTRNRGPDPYRLLPARAGCGELIYRARPNVVPVFLQGFPRYAWHAPVVNAGLLGRPRPWVHMVMGEPMHFDEYYARPNTVETWKAISQCVVDRLSALGQEERRIRAEYDKVHGST